MLFSSPLVSYSAIGCYRDTPDLAISTLENLDPVLDGPYNTRRNPISKCAVAAMRRDYKIFALKDGGLCAASASCAAPQTFDTPQDPDACLSGEGGPSAYYAYIIEG